MRSHWLGVVVSASAVQSIPSSLPTRTRILPPLVNAIAQAHIPQTNVKTISGPQIRLRKAVHNPNVSDPSMPKNSSRHVKLEVHQYLLGGSSEAASLEPNRPSRYHLPHGCLSWTVCKHCLGFVPSSFKLCWFIVNPRNVEYGYFPLRARGSL